MGIYKFEFYFGPNISIQVYLLQQLVANFIVF